MNKDTPEGVPEHADYLDPGEEPPEGMDTVEGPQGGTYVYDPEEETEGSEEETDDDMRVGEYEDWDEWNELASEVGTLTEDWDSVETVEDLEEAVENPGIVSRADIDGITDQQAGNWARAFKEVDAAGMYDQISRVTTDGDPDGNEAGYWDDDRGEMYINPEVVYDEVSAMDYTDGNSSSAHPASTILHEAAHAGHYDQADSRHEERSFTLSVDESVAEEVSERAKVNRTEFVAEVFAGIVGGGTRDNPVEYSDEVMELYEDYNGPPIPDIVR